MKVIRFFAIAASGVTLLAAVPSLADDVTLAPHRAVYDLSLLRSEGMRGVDNARGRIVFEVGGASCEGYTVSFRQVVELQSAETGPRVTDVRSSNYETGDGKSFRFVIDRAANGAATGVTEGRTALRDSGYTVSLTKPKPANVELPGDVLFPSVHTKRLIEAARAGENTVSVKVYDGSDEGQTVYDSLAVIGKPVEHTKPFEGPEKPLAGLKSWPMTISYFKSGSDDQTPVYVVTLEMFENGVSRNLKLDYGSILMKGELKQLDMGKPPKC